MIQGMLNAAIALDASMQRQEVNAENLAHMSVPGHRARGVLFQAIPRDGGRHSGLAGDSHASHPVRTYTDFQAGSYRGTGRDLDLAIEGDAFFALEGPNGQLFTRNGAFRINQEGRLVTTAGYAVLGTNGPVTIPSDASSVSVASDGSVSTNGISIGQIKLTRFSQVSRLAPVGPSLFEAPSDAGDEPATARVLQGTLETSNVTPAEAMIGMIQAARYFEAAQRALRSLAETVQLNTRPNP